MGSGISQLFPCINPNPKKHPDDVIFSGTEPDETLGHSFCYVRSSTRFLSPTPSDRFVSPFQSLRFSPPRDPTRPEPGFKAISGASVSANTSTPRTVLQLENIYDDATGLVGGSGGVKASIVDGFESTASFRSIPLQPCSGAEPASGFFMSGPIERGAFSGPIEPGGNGGGGGDGVPYSAPLGGGIYVKKKKMKGINGMKKKFRRNFSQKNRPWVVPVRNKEECDNNNGNDFKDNGNVGSDVGPGTDDVQWALGKAGEDRVHVVVSEEHGWLFVGIYDGFNGPDAPEFLMGNLYKAVFRELEGLFWDCVDSGNVGEVGNVDDLNVNAVEGRGTEECLDGGTDSEVNVKKVTFDVDEIRVRRKRLWEYLAEDPEDGVDLSGSERFAFSVDDAVSVNKDSSGASRRSLLLSRLKHGLVRSKDGGKLFSWRFGLEDKEEKAGLDENVGVGEEKNGNIRSSRKRKVGPVDHESVLRAMSRALEYTEAAYLDMSNKVLDRYPELALMGSCLLVALMRDEDVYVMNVGDSRAIVAHYEPREVSSGAKSKGLGVIGSAAEAIVEESVDGCKREKEMAIEVPADALRLTALQLSTDHSTSIEEEVIRIKNEHPDDRNCIVNDRVKGRLKVTRAFGAGFLKQVSCVGTGTDD
ncbi:protein phosphatase 2C 29 isoform X2 [Daucus carota subsp. sativus]|uniref:protein phosphatase 2C 29 isoform X2 n=1 Tax=Daucus carota subsp. sativus TaxID=79200 RepID=UPI0007EFAEEC|nr:PREDICTED: protein phosphatase 2C 29-like isoform X2 [Daucus carota subsp. sativus]